MIVASLCTIPSRRVEVESVIAGMLTGQTVAVDRLAVALNGYTEIPASLPRDPRVEYDVRCDNPGPWVRYGVAASLSDDDVFLTLDDDMVYPADYVETAVGRLNEGGGRAAGCFAAISWLPFDRVFEYGSRRLQFMVEGQLSRPRRVALPGGATGCFWARHVRGLPAPTTVGLAMNDDMLVGRELARRGVPIICWPKRSDWIREYPASRSADALYRSRSLERRRTFDQLVHEGFDPTAGAESAALECRERILVYADWYWVGDENHELDRRLCALCGPGRSVHVLACIAAGLDDEVQQRVDIPYWVHPVIVPGPEGRFDQIPLVGKWRRVRIARSVRRRWEAARASLLNGLKPTEVIDLCTQKAGGAEGSQIGGACRG